MRTSRRAFLWFAGGIALGRVDAGDSRFWNRKDPAQWSAGEIARLTMESPWARPVTAAVAAPGTTGQYGAGAGTMAAPPALQFHGLVRWESARPVLEALKTKLPEAFAGRYVISVSGIPILDVRESPRGETSVSRAATADVLDGLQGLTYLEAKGKPPAQPGIVQRGATAGALWFGFPRDLQLSPADKQVTFRTELGQLEVKVKFNLKEMMYRNQLAL
ncbi:MAG: hypothetical protein M1436_05005 [Acidobacteria bacterium]|nr:hypothetical protein [Acidobacteriota bacterium]